MLTDWLATSTAYRIIKEAKQWDNIHNYNEK